MARLLLHLCDVHLSFEDLQNYVTRLLPAGELLRVQPLGVDIDDDHAGETHKGVGYGQPVVLVVRSPEGERRLVFHTASTNDFGHDRRADRAAGMVLAYDSFSSIPQHVRAIDVGVCMLDGSLHSYSGGGEHYLVTEWVDGHPYAEDLRRIARCRQLGGQDLSRCHQLADYLIALHRTPSGRRAQYRRSVRDLVGDGEGIYGIVDGYPDGVAAASASRLQKIESACAEWRWRLREREHRSRRIHADFHPFNILFDDDDRLTLLDTSRGSVGDPADDVTCLAINYVFFAIQDPASWNEGLGELWRCFWRRYLSGTADRELLVVAPPYFAWRALVLCNPVWYPALETQHRDAILNLAETALAGGRLLPESAERLFR